MELSDSDLRKRSEALELQELQKYTFSPTRLSDLNALLLDVYAILRPTKFDYEDRRNLVHVFDSMVKNAYRPSGCSGQFPAVEPFGSFVMDMFTAKSDLDLSLNFSADETAPFPREKKISVLRMFAKILYAQQRKGKVSGVLPILRARVPVLKVVHRATDIECDISVENKDGVSRSLIINSMCLVDKRFRILSFLMKAWAKTHDINSAKDRTLSSLSITLLVAFHLQTRDPPILPPVSALLRDGPDPVSVENVVHGFQNFGRANKESVAELFIALLSKLSSVRSFWELGLCASTFDGFWISKMWKTSSIGVEDFLDRSQNCARAVGKLELPKIYSFIDSSISHLVQYMNGQVEGSELKILLFGPVSLHIRDENVVNGSKNLKKQRKKRKVPSNESIAAPDINASENSKEGRKKKKVPSHDSVPASDINGSENCKKQKKKVPSHGLVAAPDNTKKINCTSCDSVAAPENAKKINTSSDSVVTPENAKKITASRDSVAAPNNAKKINYTSWDSVSAPNKAKKINYTRTPNQLSSQIQSATTAYLALYHQPIPGQLSYEVQHHLRQPPQHYHLPHHKPQEPLLSAAFVHGPHLSGPPFNACLLGYGSHDPSSLVAHNLASGPEHYQPIPFVPLGLQSGQQTQPPSVTGELHYKPFCDAQRPLSQASYLIRKFGSHPIHPTPLVDERHNAQSGHHSQHPGQPFRPFY